MTDPWSRIGHEGRQNVKSHILQQQPLDRIENALDLAVRAAFGESFRRAPRRHREERAPAFEPAGVDPAAVDIGETIGEHTIEPALEYGGRPPHHRGNCSTSIS